MLCSWRTCFFHRALPTVYLPCHFLPPRGSLIFALSTSSNNKCFHAGCVHRVDTSSDTSLICIQPSLTIRPSLIVLSERLFCATSLFAVGYADPHVAQLRQLSLCLCRRQEKKRGAARDEVIVKTCQRKEEGWREENMSYQRLLIRALKGLQSFIRFSCPVSMRREEEFEHSAETRDSCSIAWWWETVGNGENRILRNHNDKTQRYAREASLLRRNIRLHSAITLHSSPTLPLDPAEITKKTENRNKAQFSESRTEKQRAHVTFASKNFEEIVMLILVCKWFLVLWPWEYCRQVWYL